MAALLGNIREVLEYPLCFQRWAFRNGQCLHHPLRNFDETNAPSYISLEVQGIVTSRWRCTRVSQTTFLKAQGRPTNFSLQYHRRSNVDTLER